MVLETIGLAINRSPYVSWASPALIELLWSCFHWRANSINKSLLFYTLVKAAWHPSIAWPLWSLSHKEFFEPNSLHMIEFCVRYSPCHLSRLTFGWCSEADLNCRPRDYQSRILTNWTTEAYNRFVSASPALRRTISPVWGLRAYLDDSPALCPPTESFLTPSLSLSTFPPKNGVAFLYTPPRRSFPQSIRPGYEGWSKIPDSNRPFLLGRQTC